jgi:8-oxo-dGTP pyrophosphatase MutT (NUDIX family)
MRAGGKTILKRATYRAAGGVVIDGDLVLVLRRPERNELRLPKGHVDPGEADEQTAAREVLEEAGIYGEVIADLGEQLVEFEHAGEHVARTERYFLMESIGDAPSHEPQFEPEWMRAREALAALSFEAEREWVRRALDVVNRAT